MRVSRALVRLPDGFLDDRTQKSPEPTKHYALLREAHQPGATAQHTQLLESTWRLNSLDDDDDLKRRNMTLKIIN